jgi:N-methylhydantoinase B
VFAPVFADDGELLLIASIQCHHGDTGGAMAGGYTMAKDIYSEGTRDPLLKIIAGTLDAMDLAVDEAATSSLRADLEAKREANA